MLEERSLTSGVISLLDEDGTAVSHEAGVTHNYLLCSSVLYLETNRLPYSIRD